MFKAILLALLASWQIEAGQAAYYAPGVMRQVVEIRQAGWTASPLPEDLTGTIGFVAVADCERIGQRVAIWHQSEGWAWPYLVADCANRLENHGERMKEKGIVVEVDHNTARRWGVLGLGPEHISVVVAYGRGFAPAVVDPDRPDR